MNKKTAKKSLAGMVLLAGALMMTTSAGAAPAKPPTSPKQITPTIFLHGWNGKDSSMSNLVEGFTGIHSKNTKKIKKLYSFKEDAYTTSLAYDGQEKTYVVSGNNNEYYGNTYKVYKYSFEGGKKGVLKVVFLNNEENITTNTHYFESAMKEIEKDYGRGKVNIVGHSLGGVTASFYAMKQYANSPEAKATQVNKLVTIGSPFEGGKTPSKGKTGKIGESIYDNLTNGGAEVKRMFGKAKFNPKMKVLSMGSKDDFWVSTSSAFGLEDFKNALPSKNLKKVYTTGGHSEQMYKAATIKEVKNFLKD